MPGHLSAGAQVALGRGESEKSRHVSLGPSTTSRFAARWHLKVHYWVLMSDTTGGIRNRYDFSLPMMNQNLPLKGILPPLWAPSPFSHSLYLPTELSSTQRLVLLFLLSWKYSSRPRPHSVGPQLCAEWSFMPSSGWGGDSAPWVLLDTNHFICFTFREVGLNHSFNLSKALLCSGARAHNYHKTGWFQAELPWKMTFYWHFEENVFFSSYYTFNTKILRNCLSIWIIKKIYLKFKIYFPLLWFFY